VKQHFWDEHKNEKLARERGVSFEEILLVIGKDGLVDITSHPNPVKYPNQYIYVVRMAGYFYLVPYEEVEGKIRLITIIPSRKAFRKYNKGGGRHEN